MNYTLDNLKSAMHSNLKKIRVDLNESMSFNELVNGYS